jgi:putative acetyltransferase
MNTLETERLILRSFEEADLEEFHEYAKSPNVGPNAGWPPHSSREDSILMLSLFIGSKDIWAIVYKDNHKVIGSIGLQKDPFRSADDVKMIGYVLSEEFWGRGIAAEASGAVISYAFENLNLLLLQQ